MGDRRVTLFDHAAGEKSRELMAPAAEIEHTRTLAKRLQTVKQNSEQAPILKISARDSNFFAASCILLIWRWDF
jgi:hypothetical protein